MATKKKSTNSAASDDKQEKTAKKAAKKTAAKKSTAKKAAVAKESAEKSPTTEKAKAPASAALPAATKKPSSLAASILGRPTAKDRREEAEKQHKDYEAIDISQIKPEWVGYFKELIRIREQISAQLSGLAKESAEEMTGYSLHMADSGTDNFDRDFNLSLMSSDQDSLYEIDEALKRIEKGTYGTCELTGKPIPKARLNAVPWTRFTVEAQAQLERNGEIKQKRLGALGTLEKAASSSASDSDDDDSSSAKTTKDKD